MNMKKEEKKIQSEYRKEILQKKNICFTLGTRVSMQKEVEGGRGVGEGWWGGVGCDTNVTPS